MALPTNFKEWDHLRSVLIRIHNRWVREEFSDLGGENWDADITAPRGSLRVASTIKATDSAIMVTLRFFLYYFLLRKAADLQAPLYGIPTTELQVIRRFKPQIQLHFMQDADRNYERSKSPAKGQITFRLMNETSETITGAEVERLARAVKTEFITGGGYVWSKGRLMAAYTDREKGYQLQLNCYNETSAKTLIAKVLSIQNHTMERKRLTFNRNDDELEAYPTVLPTMRILGETYREPKRRPVADVRFTHAELHLCGKEEAIILCDRTHRYINPIVEAS